MPFDFIIIIFSLFTAGAYLLLGRNLVNIICGFVLLSNGANLFILSVSGSPQGKGAPILTESGEALVDPLPQAMILTAIVIGLGMLALLAAVIYKVYLVKGSEDTRQYTEGNQ